MSREAVVAEARTWIGTPYHHRAHVKGSGVDCAWLMIEVFAACGVMEAFDPGHYSNDWHMHRHEEMYLANVLDRAEEIDYGATTARDADASQLLPGTILMWRWGRTFSHGGIVTKWPYFIHSSFPSRMVEEVSVLHSMLTDREMRAFCPLEFTR